MSYELVYTRRAARDIAKLDVAARKRIQKKLEKFGMRHCNMLRN